MIAVRASMLAAASIALLSADPAPLYMPRAIKNAFAHGTRSADGRPGPRYWQNHGRYAIRINAAPPDRTIRGSEEITYVNESPDSLGRLNIKLLLNIHKPGAPRDGGASEGYLTPGVQIDRFTINGQTARWPGRDGTFTNQGIQLPARLMPHDSVRLGFDWHYEIAREAGREGMIDTTTYYLAYFYPRVAVYDDYNGWDQMDFTDQQEFYSDFNDYDVTVRAPANFLVWGTGTLTDAAQVLQGDALARFQASMTTDSTIRIATLAQLRAHAVTAAGQPNEWHFTATNVPDVAFGISDHYDWDGGSVTVDDTGRRVSIQAAYNDSAADFRDMVQQAGGSLAWLSRNWPGVPYPYEKTTVFQGGAGMEYPMMVNDEAYADSSFSRFVAAHEIAHTWFPFYMGINETRYGFMDEGWATTFEFLLNSQNMGVPKATTFYQQFRVNGWARDPSPLEDLPIITPEDMLKNQAYGNNAYGKPSLGYLATKDMLGDEMFGRCLHAFMERWHGKHPIPWDFFNTFNDVSGRNLNWFWNAWYFGNGYIDLAVRGATRSRGGYTVDLANIGGMPAPVNLEMHYADGTADTLHQTSAIWMNDLNAARVNIPTRKTLQSVRLTGGIWVDADTTNNSWSGH
ncbi:MAG TPA: M1 family metallopeptidase [Gemmatimonadales bacterium]|jgi:hypothetical protein